MKKVAPSSSTPSTSNTRLLMRQDPNECVICHEEMENKKTAACGCSFCKLCILEYLASISSNPIPCPSCSEPLTVDLDTDNNQDVEEEEEEPEDCDDENGSH